jgi:hypothetical protein
VAPNILVPVRRLVEFGMLPPKGWFIDWVDLTKTYMGENIDRADWIAETNEKMKDTGKFIFTPEEIRKPVGYEP